jgi:hypothetical protein
MCHRERLHRLGSREGHKSVGIAECWNEYPAGRKSHLSLSTALEPGSWKAISPVVGCGDGLVTLDFKNVDSWLIHLSVPTDGLFMGVCSIGTPSAMYLVFHRY